VNRKELASAAAVAAALAATALTAFGGDPAAGHAKAVQCQACHGLDDGMGKIPQAPHLAGQNEAYLVKALKDYRSGARKDPMMSVVAAGLTDGDIDDLAAYFHSVGSSSPR